MIPTGLVMGVFVVLFQLFSQYAKGNIFDAINISQIKKIAYLLLARTLIGPFYEVLITVVWTINNPAGENLRMIRLLWFSWWHGLWPRDINFKKNRNSQYNRMECNLWLL
jgi:hypothetical protein